jgi:transcriptional regulator with XRE-family HTH domain/Zn-dependent peptidase ImmA (M78 family)
MSEPWNSSDYQTLETVSFDGRLHVRFANGDESVLEVDRLLAREPDGLNWPEARPHAQELIVPGADGEVAIAWTTLRAQSDPRFAAFMMEEADEDARRIGRRLRILREQRGMSSKDVAAAAGIAPMSLSRIELGRHDVVFRTLRRILAAMDYTLRDLAEVVEPGVEIATVREGLKNAGVVDTVIKQLSRAFADDPMRLVPAVHRIFGLSSEQLTLANPAVLVPSVAGARFKSAANQNPALTTYTMWAHWLALLVDQACPRDPAGVPENPFAIREEILANYGSMRFEHLLRWCWDHDVAVLPLHDPGEFHGACWSIDGRAVVVLKQLTPWPSRWSFDLSHELGHLARHVNAGNTSVVELAELNPAAADDDDDEHEASDFAGELQLGDAAALARTLADRTGRRLPRLKTEVVKLAKERGVEADALANYMAYRLAAEGEDWWATAAKLQDTSNPAPEAARDALVAHVKWERLSEDDAMLLKTALDWGRDDD